MIYVWASILLVVLMICCLLNLFGLPGNWINLVALSVYVYFTPEGQRPSISWWVVAVVLVLAILGEIVEFAAGAVGAAKVGGSRRSAALAILGSFIGGIAGALIGVPIPIIGSVIAILLFASAGALVGAMLGEWWKGRDWEACRQVGHAAFWGRLFGTFGKFSVGALIVLVALVSLVWK
jgi:uncharacterized protein YqgC (DUF456 family)